MIKTRHHLRNFKHKIKNSLKQKFLKLLPTAIKSSKSKNQKSKARWKLRKKHRDLEAMRQRAYKVIVNKTELVLDDADKKLLLLGLSFIPTLKFSNSELESVWTELNQHIRRIEWDSVFSNPNKDNNDELLDPDEHRENGIPSRLRFVKHSRPFPAQIDEETRAYTDLCTAQIRNLKPIATEQYHKRNNLSPELQASLKKLTTIAKAEDHVFCRSDKDGKIVIITRKDFDTIMSRELEKDEVEELNY